MIFRDCEKIERWRTHLSADHVSPVTSPHALSEGASDGAARLECSFAAATLRFRLDGDFPGLKTRKCADGAFLVDPWGTAPRAHIIELKRTVKLGNWAEIKEQFYGALLRVAAVGSLCDIRIASVACYVAFREEKITLDPVLAKLPQYADAFREWHGEQPLRLPGLRPERVQFQPVRLAPDTGTGSLDLLWADSTSEA